MSNACVGTCGLSFAEKVRWTIIFGCLGYILFAAKIGHEIESVDKVGEDFAPIAFIWIGYAIKGEQGVEWVKPS